MPFVIPAITWFIAYFGNKSSETLVDNFIEKISKIKYHEAYSGDLSDLNDLVNSLPTEMQTHARKIIQDYTKPKKSKSIDPEVNLAKEAKEAKEKVLSLLDTAPKPFLWNKEQLSGLLEIEKQNGEFFLVFTKTYKQLFGHYDSEKKETEEYEAVLFETFISNIFNVPVKRAEKEDKSSEGVENYHLTLTCRVKVQDINEAELHPEVLHKFYQAYEVVNIFKAAILHWVGQAANVHHKKLANKIAKELKPVLNRDGGFNIKANNSETEICDYARKSQKEEAIEDKQEIHMASITQLKNYLDKIFGEETFSLKGIFDVDSRDDSNDVCFKEEVKFEVKEDKFEAILDKVSKQNKQPIIGFGSMFYHKEEVNDSDNDDDVRPGTSM